MDALSIDTKILDLVTITVANMLKIAFFELFCCQGQYVTNTSSLKADKRVPVNWETEKNEKKRKEKKRKENKEKRNEKKRNAKKNENKIVRKETKQKKKKRKEKNVKKWNEMKSTEARR